MPPSKPSFFRTERGVLSAQIFMVIMYAVGILGFLTKIHPDFPLLTPFNLVLSLSVVLFFHPKSARFTAVCFAIGIIGYLIEVVGVNTGRIFGAYQYGSVLGFKLWNTPLSIGVNWLLLTYCSAMFVNQFVEKKAPWLLKAVCATAIMVCLDVLIEPVAIKTGMWSWAGNVVPLQNYFGWYLSALPLQILLFSIVKDHKNSVAVVVFILQIIFFAVL